MPRATLKQRPDGRYACKYKGKFFYGATQSEAYQARDAYKNMLQQGLKAENLGLTVRQYAMRWLSIRKADTPNKDMYAHHMNRLLDLVGDRLMRDVDASDIKAFYNQYIGMSQSSINKARITVNGFFRDALADRIIQFDPCLSVSSAKGYSGTHRAITADERQLIHAVDHRLRPGVMVMLYAGLRRGEALAINIDRDVDFLANTITVHTAVHFEGGKPILGDPKTEAGARTIPMARTLSDELQGLHGLLMPSASGDIMSESAFDRAWQSYLSALCTHQNGCHKRWYGKMKEHQAILASGGTLPPWHDVVIRPHDLRHSYCTMLYDAGIDIKTAMKWMGHADQAMTMRIYTHLTEQREAEAQKALIEQVDKMFGSQNGSQLDDCIKKIAYI